MSRVPGVKMARRRRILEALAPAIESPLWPALAAVAAYYLIVLSSVVELGGPRRISLWIFMLLAGPANLGVLVSFLWPHERLDRLTSLGARSWSGPVGMMVALVAAAGYALLQYDGAATVGTMMRQQVAIPLILLVVVEVLWLTVIDYPIEMKKYLAEVAPLEIAGFRRRAANGTLPVPQVVQPNGPARSTAEKMVFIQPRAQDIQVGGIISKKPFCLWYAGIRGGIGACGFSSLDAAMTCRSHLPSSYIAVVVTDGPTVVWEVADGARKLIQHTWTDGGA